MLIGAWTVRKVRKFKPVSVLKGGIQYCVYGRGNVRSPWTLGVSIGDLYVWDAKVIRVSVLCIISANGTLTT